MLPALLALASLIDLAQELARLVDLAAPRTRAEAAAEQAARPEATLPEWLAAARAFGQFGEPRGERGFVHVPLVVLGETEPTNLHVFVPETYRAGRPAPLIVALHDQAEGGEQAIALWVEVARAFDALILAPTEPRERDRHAFQARERENVLAGLRWMRRNFDVDERRVLLCGTGRGAELAWELGLRHPDRWAALVPFGAAPSIDLAPPRDGLRYLDGLLGVPIRDLQGGLEQGDRVDVLRQVFQRLERRQARDARLLVFPDRGANVDFGAVDWIEWLSAARRDPVPARVVCCGAAPGARNAWVEITGVERDVSEDVRPFLPGADWRPLEPANVRARMWQEVDKHTARLEAERDGPGRFRVRSNGVASFRLLLTEEMLGQNGQVEVRWNGKRLAKTAIPAKGVLLAEFAERCDRTFLPVAAVELP